jgi:hypothetical protein
MTAQNGLVVTVPRKALKLLKTCADRLSGVQRYAKTDGNFWRVYAPLAAFWVDHCSSSDDWPPSIKSTSKRSPEYVRNVFAWDWIVDRNFGYPLFDTDKRCHGFHVEETRVLIQFASMMETARNPFHEEFRKVEDARPWHKADRRNPSLNKFHHLSAPISRPSARVSVPTFLPNFPVSVPCASFANVSNVECPFVCHAAIDSPTSLSKEPD